MTKKQLIEKEQNAEGMPFVRRIMQVCEDKAVLIKAGAEHREVLEKAGFTYVTNATEIRRVTSFKKVAVAPCACGNLLSTKKTCSCSEKLLVVYENRLQNMYARADVTIIIDGTNSLFLGDLTPPFITVNQKDYDIDSECENLLRMIKERFSISYERVLKIATALVSLDQQEKLSKAHILEAFSFFRR